MLYSNSFLTFRAVFVDVIDILDIISPLITALFPVGKRNSSWRNHILVIYMNFTGFTYRGKVCKIVDTDGMLCSPFTVVLMYVFCFDKWINSWHETALLTLFTAFWVCKNISIRPRYKFRFVICYFLSFVGFSFFFGCPIIAVIFLCNVWMISRNPVIVNNFIK